MLGISHHVAIGDEVVTEDQRELLYGKIRKIGTDFPIFGTDFLIHVRFPYYMYARAYSAYARK